jgi:iron complex transport system permease protein
LSALAGALLVLFADTLARVIANPVEIPIGAVTALIGAPVFFILLRRTRARQGGWA